MFTELGNRVIERVLRPVYSHPILDPISTLVRLGLYNLQPSGTKLSVTRHSIQFDSPGVGQGVVRSMSGSSREDLSALAPCLVKICEWFDMKQDENFQFLIGRAIRGLEALSACYHSTPGASGLLLNTIQLYINLLRHPTENKITTPESKCLPESLRDIWTADEIALICKMLKHMESYQRFCPESMCLEHCIEHFLTAKDKRVEDAVAL